MKPEINAMTPYEWLLLTILSIVWGGSFFFVGVAVEALPPLTIVALRVSLAMFTLVAVVYFTGLRMPTSPKVWIAFIFMGILNNAIPFTLIVWGQTHIATGQAAGSSFILIPLAVFHDKPFTLPMPGFEIWLAILGLALISTAFAYILYFRILSTAGATNLLLVTLLIPVSAILLGTAILGEQLEHKHVVGMGLISIGLLSMDGRAFPAILNRFTKRQTTHQH